jgi:hypothetical protein
MQIRDLNVCPTLNSSNFKSYFENFASNSIYFNYHDAFELSTYGEGSEIDDVLLFRIKREIESIHDVPKPYIVNVSDY